MQNTPQSSEKPASDQMSPNDQAEPQTKQVGSSDLLDDSTLSGQTTKTHPCRCLVKPVSVLTLLKLRFLSYSDLMAHLEQHPASVEIVERMIHRCLSLKPLLSQWIQDGRPETDWPENDNLQKDLRSPKEKQRALRESYMAFE